MKWFGEGTLKQWRDIKVIVFLNHTSLFEVLYLKLAPIRFIWRISSSLIVPGADITLRRPILGKFIKLLIPGCLPITRKRDETWSEFLEKMKTKSVIAILPEGRMKRKDGFDKDGNEMTVRGGTSDILEYVDDGKILFVYSGGLHHVQAPGEKFPRLFKKIHVNLEMLPIKTYKEQILSHCSDSFKRAMMADLNHRLAHSIPSEK